ncbi:MAG: aminotransferase class III-fold pyridoxal phosphate-dependent enzyme [Deltaproteobacteria bacterium]|nr:aminotransferase class III-fold pyridoxal phosphate-dependent enzyme [Deltaproteobacteria bacterium]
MEAYIKEYMTKTPGSAKLYARAEKVMPGGICHNPRYFAPYPLYINKAEGSKIWDVDGNAYIDLWMGHYSHILGHKPEVIMKLMPEIMAQEAHWGIVNEYQITFAEDICRIVPCAEKVRFGVSGTEATMHAVRLARGYTGRKIILKVKGGWHGSNNDLSVAVHAPMDVPESSGLPAGLTEYTRTISFNDTEGAIAAIHQYKSDLAAVLIEAVGQYFIPPVDGFLQTIQAELKKVGALFMVDEVITGGRLSLRGAQGRYSLQPDLCTMGKVLGGGMNLGLVAGRKEILDLASPTAGLPKGKGVLIGGGTFSCMIPSMIAGRAMLRYLEAHEQEIYPALEKKGQKVREGVEKAFQARGIPARCLGVGSLFTTCFPPSADTPVRNIEDVETKTDMAKREKEFRLGMLNKGVYTMYGGGALSMAHTDEDMNRIIRAAEEVAKEMAGGKK